MQFRVGDSVRVVGNYMNGREGKITSGRANHEFGFSFYLESEEPFRHPVYGRIDRGSTHYAHELTLYSQED